MGRGGCSGVGGACGVCESALYVLEMLVFVVLFVGGWLDVS